jgi:hypothetical protein
MQLLRDAARDRLHVIVLDDLHEADPASLLLLRFVARELHDARLLVIGTYRDLEARSPVERGRLLVQIGRYGETIGLDGLDETETAALIAGTVGWQPRPPVVAAIRRVTDGNPFATDELVRLLVSQGRLAGPEAELAEPTGLPASVRDTILARLGPLSASCRDVLAVASVLGREFSVAHLSALHAAGETGVDAALDEATRAGLLHAPERPALRHRFTHALVREALYEELADATRRRLHARAGEVLEQIGQRGRPPDAAELAHHFWLAGLESSAPRVLACSARAAREALRRLAYEEAALHAERALAALAVADPATATERGDLQLLLGDARWRAGERRPADEAFLQAHATAIAAGNTRQAARAALGYARHMEPFLPASATMIRLLEDALERVGGEDASLRVRLLARLAGVLPERERIRARGLGEQAVRVARELGNPATLAYAMNALQLALWDPEGAEQRLAVAGEIVALAEAGGARDVEIYGRIWRQLALLELGDLAAAEREMAAFTRLAEELRQPFFLWHVRTWHAMRALLTGDLVAAERAIDDAHAFGLRAQNPNARLRYFAQLSILRREQGRLGELEAPMRALAETYAAIPALRSGIAFLEVERGALSEARVAFDAIAHADFSDLPRDANWIHLLGELAHIAAALGDARRAERLYALLRPYAGRNVVVGFAEFCEGSVARLLGVLAATMGDVEDACRHFETALAQNVRMHARPFVAYTQWELGRLLRDRVPSAAGRARELLTAAAATARELGMAALLAKLEREASAPAAAAVPAAPAVTASFTRDGRGWRIEHAGEVCRLPDTIGLRCLAELLRRPNEDLHVLHLTDVIAENEDGEATGVPLGDAGMLLDGKAKQAYRHRLRDLREILADATAAGHAARAETATREIEQLAAELKRAVGLGGRARRAGSLVERSRINLTKAIKAAIRKIAAANPALGHHLRSCVRTGTSCRYEPDPTRPVRWS